MGLRPRFRTPLSQARDKFARYLIRPFDVFEPQTRLHIGFAGLVVITTALIGTNFSPRFTEDYKIGDVVTRTIVSPADITTTDVAETEKRKAAARETTRPIFNYDSTRASSSAQSFRAAWNELKNQKVDGKNAQWSGEGGPEVARAIIAHQFSENDLDRLTSLIRETGEKHIFDDAEADRLTREIVLVDVRNPSGHLIMPEPADRMVSLNAARRNLEERILSLEQWSQPEKTALVSAILPLLRPNVILDQTATATAQEVEAGKVLPVVVSLKRNQHIAREGDSVTPAMLLQFAAVKNATRGRPWQNMFGLLLVVFAIYLAVWKFTEHRSTATALALSKRRAFALVGSAIVVQTALLRIGFILGDSLAAQMSQAPFSNATIWNFAIPFAAASLLVAMLIDTQLAFIAGVVCAIFAGLLAPNGIQQSIYAVISCAAAVYGIGRYRERQSVTLAGLFVGGVNILMALALLTYAESFSWSVMLFAAACAFTSGLLTAVFTAGGLPINESLFGILTDVKLLELSNADLPVLGQMAIRAPGTNQHSHAVGQLAEDACRSVGANPLLSRIGALYHDIGKLAAPEYFVENQQGENPHDRLRPVQSAKIITSHVTYGLRLAKEIGLPKKIADFIPQHHGTRTLHFFLRKAQALAKPDEVVHEKDFRYPGPKPQFKEAAIMMLADSCEAAARSLERPDPENIRAIVQKIVDAIISDGQLNECDITLRELTTIREAMISALTAIYHARIDYPGFNPPALSGPLPKLSVTELDSEERGVSYRLPSEVPISKGGEVEDEAITRKISK
jgi:cyclic-di-AMP phosphodiesterase PgpH